MSEVQYLKALARYSNDIRTGAINFDYRTGQCGPPQATMVKSWGAACPTGYCPPDHLPEALGRWFAGDRAGCKEAPYTVKLSGITGAAVVPVSVTRNAEITMCPTRVLAWTNNPSATAAVLLTKIQFGAQNQLIGGPVPVEAFDPQAFQDVPIVPDCLKAGLPFTVSISLGIDAGAENVDTWITFIGPMVG